MSDPFPAILHEAPRFVPDAICDTAFLFTEEPMRITTITVRHGRTHNLGNYSNTRPEVELTAEVEAGDDPRAVADRLLDEARAIVEEQIDQDLERVDQPAHYSRDPRYQVVYTSEAAWISHDRGRDQRVVAPERLIIILPDGLRLPREAGQQAWWSHLHDGRKLRLDHARRKAAEWGAERETFRIVDCADGDLTRVPGWVFASPADLLPPPDPADGDPKPARDIDEYEGDDGDEEDDAL